MCKNKLCQECKEREAVVKGLCKLCYNRAFKRRKREEERQNRQCECGEPGVAVVYLYVGFRRTRYVLCADCLAAEQRYGEVEMAR